MKDIDWTGIFVGETPGNGASDAELQALASAIGKPLTEEEIKTAHDPQTDPVPAPPKRRGSPKAIDPRKWQLPDKPLPPAYLSFLKWSNGGSFYNGHRGFNFLSTSTVRSFALGYHFPEHLPGALPFAFDGGDNFYLFDMRADPVDGEYPILFVHADKQDYAEAAHVADTFVEACQAKTDPVKLLKD